MLNEIIRPLTGAADWPDPPPSQRPELLPGGGYLKFRNDRGVPEICIGVTKGAGSVLISESCYMFVHRLQKVVHFAQQPVRFI